MYAKSGSLKLQTDQRLASPCRVPESSAGTHFNMVGLRAAKPRLSPLET